MSNMHLVTGYAGKTHVTAADHGAFWAAVVGNGEYVLDAGQKFAATKISDNQIRIADGEMLIQGRHARIPTGETVDLTIENGTNEMNRIDLIVARYSKAEDTGVESMELVVIQGEPSEASPAEPEYTTGDIFNGDRQHDFPLYKLEITDVELVNITPLFESTQLSIYDMAKMLGASDLDGAPTSEFPGTPGMTCVDTSVTPNGYYVCLGQDENGYIWKRMGYMETEIVTQIFTASTSFKTPTDYIPESDVRILCFGGGGASGMGKSDGAGGGGGGGGYMSTYTGKLDTEKTYSITIGVGGTSGAGGATSFDSLVSASGGGVGTVNGSYSGNGGNGGTGGGGNGGNGSGGGNGGNGTYGGGGGGGGDASNYGANGGNGGTYGGGGGGGGGTSAATGGDGGASAAYSGGNNNGARGGGGAGYSAAGNNGTSTKGGVGGKGLDTTSEKLLFSGSGTAGTAANIGGGGGGGYGGNGGAANAAGGGGGGYGGNGGAAGTRGGGGGGGYGGDGAAGTAYSGGGGGGYGPANYGAGGTATASGKQGAGKAGVIILEYKKYALI